MCVYVFIRVLCMCELVSSDVLGRDVGSTLGHIFNTVERMNKKDLKVQNIFQPSNFVSKDILIDF